LAAGKKTGMNFFDSCFLQRRGAQAVSAFVNKEIGIDNAKMPDTTCNKMRAQGGMMCLARRQALAKLLLRSTVILGFFLLVRPPAPLHAAPASAGPGEYEIKAAFLFNFAKFVDWPEKSFATPIDPLVIGVFSQISLRPAFEKTLQGKVVRGHPVVVLELKTKEEAGKCQILFLGKVENRQVEQWLNSLAGTAVLTVGESKGFASRGGIINFFLVEDQVRFEINPKAAEKAGLKISSQLLSLAKIAASSQ
jgi:preprotein translocase subunit Sec61beta